MGGVSISEGSMYPRGQREQVWGGRGRYPVSRYQREE